MRKICLDINMYFQSTYARNGCKIYVDIIQMLMRNSFIGQFVHSVGGVKGVEEGNRY